VGAKRVRRPMKAAGIAGIRPALPAVARTAAARPRRRAVTPTNHVRTRARVPRRGARDRRHLRRHAGLRSRSRWRSVVAALAALLAVRPFSRFALSALRGGVFNGNAFAETPAAGMFVLGAVPTTALVYPLSHGLVTLAGAAIVGGLRFRPLVRVLDGKPLPTLPLRKEVDATPPVGPDLSEPGDSGSGLVRSPGRSGRSDIPPGCNAARTLPSTSATRPRTSRSSARRALVRPPAMPQNRLSVTALRFRLADVGEAF